MSSRRRRLFIFCALAAGAVLIAVAALHTPWARARVLTAVLARIAPDGSVQADRLDYRLPTLWFQLHGLQLRTPGRERPYFQVAEVTVDLPWSATWRGLAFQNIELRRPRFTVFVDAEGTSNFEGDATRLEAYVPIDRLRLSELQIDWHDAASGYEFTAGDISLDLGDSIVQRLEMPTAAQLRVGDEQTAIELAGGTLGWDGRDFSVDALRLESDGAHLEVNGAIDRLLADRELTLALQAQAPLEAIANLGGIDVAGEVLSATGLLMGPALAPTLDLAVAAQVATVRGLELRQVSGNVGADSEMVRLSALRAELGDGALSGDVSIGLGTEAPSNVQLAWRDLDPTSLLRGAGTPESVAVATALTGETQARWRGPAAAIEDVDAAFSTRLAETSPGAGAVALGGRLDAELANGVWGATVDASVGGALRIDAELTGAIEDRSLEGTANLVADDVSLAARSLAEVVPDLPANLAEARGLARAELVFSGSVIEPRLAGLMRLEQLHVDGAGPVTAATDLVASAESISLRNASAQFPGGTLEADLDLRADRQVSGRVRGAANDIAATLSAFGLDHRVAAVGGVSGAVDWDLRLGGTLPLAGIEGTVSAGAIRLGDGVPIDVEARVSPSTYGIRVDSLTAVAGDNPLELGGVIGADGQHVDLMGELELAAPGELADRPELGYVESARAEIAIGADLAASTVIIDLWSLLVDLPRFPVRSLTPGRVTWSPTEVSVEDFALRVGDLDLAVGGRLGDDTSLPGLRGRLRGDLSRLSDLATMALTIAAERPDVNEIALAGDLDIDLHVGGTLAEPRPEGSLRIVDGRVEHGAATTLEALQLRASVDGEILRLAQLGGRWQGAELEADGEIPLALLLDDTDRPATEAAALRARLGPLRPAALEWLLGPELIADLDGEAAVSLRATFPTLEPMAARADLQLDSLQLTSNDITLSQLRPTRLRLEDGTLRIVDWTWTRPGRDDLSLMVSGSIELADQQQLDLQIESQLQLAWLTPLIEAAALKGSAGGTVAITGSAAAPRFDGRIDVADG